tara:strand:- start:453 stop:1118 length:666 start_codon:yes stop_codon:yes gene_type:complete
LHTYLVTGANRGIGLEYCRQLKARGENVIATCRSKSDELSDLGIRIDSGIDLNSINSIRKLRSNLTGIKIDVLINNAGIMINDEFENIKQDTILQQFSTNAISPLILTLNLIENLSKGSKIILMTSRMGSIKDNESGGYYGYRMSKSALCMAGKSLSVDLKPLGIAVALLHPGLVSTRMTNYTSHGISSNESVIRLLKIIDNLTISETGIFRHANGEELPW